MVAAQLSVPLAHSLTSTQVPSEFLSYPEEHEQLKEPALLTQVSTMAAQVWLPAVHSLISAQTPLAPRS